MQRDSAQNAAERGRPEWKNLETINGVWKPCNPLKFHKTAKTLFGKAWSKTRDFWKCLEKGLEGAFIPPPLLPAWIVEERSDEATQEQRRATDAAALGERGYSFT